jgi:hypothetical protein
LDLPREFLELNHYSKAQCQPKVISSCHDILQHYMQAASDSHKMADNTATAFNNPYIDDRGRHYVFVIGISTNPKRRSRLIRVIGPPGCGKTSACRMLQDDTSQILHVSIGDSLRKLRAQPDQAQIKAVLDSNRLMTGSGLQSLIKQRVAQAAEEPRWITEGLPFKSILVDGFPRSVTQWTEPSEHNPAVNLPVFLWIAKPR